MPLPLTPWVMFRLPESSGVWFSIGWLFTRGWGARAPPLPGSRPTWSSLPPLLVHASAAQATWLPPPSPSPLSLPLLSSWSHTRWYKVWAVVLDVCASFCYRRGCLDSKTEGQNILFLWCPICFDLLKFLVWIYFDVQSNVPFQQGFTLDTI